MAAVGTEGKPGDWSEPLAFVTLDTAHTAGVSHIDIHADALVVFPNPAQTAVTVRVGEPAEVSLLDASGRTVAVRQSREADVTFDLSNVPSGTFMVRAITAGNVRVGKVVVE